MDRGFYTNQLRLVTAGFLRFSFGPGPVIWQFLFIDNQSGYWFTQKWQKNRTGPDLKALIPTNHLLNLS
jgi:hypothetical protein